MSENEPLIPKKNLAVDPTTVSTVDESATGTGTGALDASTRSGGVEVDGTQTDVSVAPRNVVAGAPLTVTCRVCKSVVNIEGKTGQHVVKCSNCSEATPIRAAPSGKKYVRCPCNCLLICKASSNRIACPRSNCKRVITLGTSPVGVAVRAPPGTCRVTCVHCNEVFMFNTLSNTLAHCPHCRVYSSIGNNYLHKWSLIYSTLTLIALLIGIGLSIGTYRLAQDNPGVYASWAVVYLTAFLLFLRCLYYFRMKVSTVEGPL